MPKLGKTQKAEKMHSYLAMSGHGQSVPQSVPFIPHAQPRHGTRHEGAGTYAFKCAIMTGYASLVDDSNTVSGSRECSGRVKNCTKHL